MGITKRLNLSNIFLFLYLALFPLGQIIRIGVFHPTDIVVFCAAVYAVSKKIKRPELFTLFQNFIFVAFCTWLFSFFIFQGISIFYGLLYLIRLVSYFYFFVYVYDFVQKSNKNKKLIYQSLSSMAIASAIFGWIQFFTIPDLKPFFTWGWDEHLYRLAGTFLDPTFLGLILVFGVFISLSSKKWLTAMLMIISLAFTYSRASYLAFLIGLPFLLSFKKNMKQILVIASALIILVATLPTTKNHSIEIFRTFSAVARVENYKTTLNIVSKSPIFGVGYNNMCIAYQKYIGPQSFSSHACSGSDSSILFILATTGVLGIISFTALSFGILKNIYKDKLLMSMSVAVAVHSIFSNSLFYPWVMGFFVLMLSARLGDKVKD